VEWIEPILDSGADDATITALDVADSSGCMQSIDGGQWFWMATIGGV